MLETQTPRKMISTFQFWFVMLASAVAVGSWQLGLFSSGSDESTEVAESTSTPDVEFDFWQADSAAQTAHLDRPDSAKLPNRPAPTPGPKELFLVDLETHTADASAAESSVNGADLALAAADSAERTDAPERFADTETTSEEVPQNVEAWKKAPAQNSEAIHDENLQLVAGGETPGQTDALTTTLNARQASAQQANAIAVARQMNDAIERIDLTRINELLRQQQDVRAHRLLSVWYWKFPQQRAELMPQLSMLSRRIYFQAEPHFLDPYPVQFGEHLETIAAEYQVPWEYLAKLNHTDPNTLQAGAQLKVIQGPFGCVVDLGDHELTVHAHGYYVVRFPVGLGRDGKTPTGKFHVVNKLIDPTYYGPDGVVAHDDPQNPLGERWLEINDEAGSLDGYGIHGTIDPQSIGKDASEGCVRLRNEDVMALYDLLSVGSEVVIRE